MIRLSRENCFPFCIRIVRRNVTSLSRCLAGGFDKNYRLVSRAADSDIKQLILFLVEQVVLVAAQRMTKQLVIAFRNGVFCDIEKRFVVGRPYDTVDAFDLLGKNLASAEVFDMQ